jgi:hypothetical protein
MAENKDEIIVKKDEATPETALQGKSYVHDHGHMKKMVVIGGLAVTLILIVGLVGMLVAGRFVRNREFTNNFRGNTSYNLNSERRMMGGRMMLNFGSDSIQGNVTAVNGQKITLNVDGTSKTVQIGTDTRFPLDSSTKIVVGNVITVIGEQDSNGVIQAQRIVVDQTAAN